MLTGSWSSPPSHCPDGSEPSPSRNRPEELSLSARITHIYLDLFQSTLLLSASVVCYCDCSCWLGRLWESGNSCFLKGCPTYTRRALDYLSTRRTIQPRTTGIPFIKKIHLFSRGCPRLSIASQEQIRDLKYHTSPFFFRMSLALYSLTVQSRGLKLIHYDFVSLSLC